MIWEVMEQADGEVKSYLKETFEKFLNRAHFEEWIDVHAGYGSPPATYFILEQLKAFISNG